MNQQFQSFLEDDDLVEEVCGRAAEGKLPFMQELGISGDRVERALARRPGPAVGDRAPASPEPGAGLRAIVLLHGRPTLLVQNGTFVIPESQIWRRTLRDHRINIENAIDRVGRVELHNHMTYDWVGTGWLVAEGIVVTNRHVAELFAAADGLGGYTFATNVLGDTIGARIDFREEYEIPVALEFKVRDILYVADRGEPDIALLAIETDRPLPDPVPMAEEAVCDRQSIGVIGYPAFDSRNGLEPMRRLFEDIYNVKRFAPGKVSAAAAGRHYFIHDCTTLGGSSGSKVIDLETGHVVGLHFSGSFLEGNFAVKTTAIRDALKSLAFSVTVPGPGVPEAMADGRHESAFFQDRDGYRPDFLGGGDFAVPLPGLGKWSADAAVRTDGRESGRHVLKFRHFSVVMSKSRKLPLVTAVNINGGEARRAFRKNDRWFIDLRIDEAFQVGNEVYRHNELDRGHMVRRLDPVWGSRQEAQQANEDTFHYVNAAPQHKDLNRKDWAGLEDYILDSTKAMDLKVSVLTGPVLRNSDRQYRGLVKLPEEFWKVAILIHADTGKLSAAGYVLSQGEIIRDLTEVAFVFGEFRTYQVQIAKIEAATGLDFGALRDVDVLGPGAAAEAAGLPRARLIADPADLIL
jgi:endonuclease G